MKEPKKRSRLHFILLQANFCQAKNTTNCLISSPTQNLAICFTRFLLQQKPDEMRSGFSFLFKKDELETHRIASKELRIKDA